MEKPVTLESNEPLNQVDGHNPANLQPKIWSALCKPDTPFDYPAYLFWKVQSQLTKLASRLNKVKRNDLSD